MSSGFKFTPNKSVMRTIRAAEKKGMFEAAEHVRKESNEVVPIEKGDLGGSAVASVDDKGTRAAVSYDTPYAVKQHEDLSLRHDDGREAKYLEKTLARERGAVRKVIADEIRRVTR
ncbi:minor capsid protein [Acaricomes phytoseiuli]|uniref:minor capsid protein n=1 Tax=Acaricomes phytoseiuli TaxID=291968 RepID=UPI000475D9C9|nr:minor capsid protein [Acaricomes phytoseiuli]